MKGIIYKYTFPDGKVYIGQTRNPERRKKDHVDSVNGPSNSGFWEAWKHFGTYEYEVLCEIESDNIDELVTKLNYYESSFIHQYHSDNPMFGYNRSSYGIVSTGSKKILEEALNKKFLEIYEPRRDFLNRAADKIIHTKQPLTKEELYLITKQYCDRSIWYKHVKHYDFSKKIRMTESASFYIEEYLDELGKIIYYDADLEAFEFVRNNYEKIIEEERSKKAIVQLDKQGNVVKEYLFIEEICQVFNVPRADNVRNVLKGKQKTAYGFYWKYKKDM